mmetsp:Transcript_18753/g.21559  ORF Transcript_18753/g.21559 Transcript_18753/m.21559 type:complete len:176 (-) Transcript_18753:25-552(-)|eukprot:CAMPEP_0168340058 /NCGR_PEP_ID=MMETSP0213-20121227/13839_1 /TAXON_ID=151035 /ORGANISM="Euplotes harpa, Strain FSP1.4" /LENGTH=175 /DNA_ID=CAMNT_0008346225 /DNA_START=261 /DNA_END=788 /DNA_ORIENTATION=+
MSQLTVEKILEFARKKCNINDYMPDIEKKYPNRSWVCTVVNTLIEDDLSAFIAETLREKETKIVMKKKLAVNAIPEIADLFKNSVTRSHDNCKFYQYIRNERRRTYKEISSENNAKAEEIEELVKAKNDLEEMMVAMSNEHECYKRAKSDEKACSRMSQEEAKEEIDHEDSDRMS